MDDAELSIGLICPLWHGFSARCKEVKLKVNYLKKSKTKWDWICRENDIILVKSDSMRH